MKKRRRRICLTTAEKAVMWDRWKQGDSTHAIARLLDTSHTSIRRNLAPSGGILSAVTAAFGQKRKVNEEKPAGCRVLR